MITAPDFSTVVHFKTMYFFVIRTGKNFNISASVWKQENHSLYIFFLIADWGLACFRQRWSLTVGVRVWQRHSMPGELLEGPELVDTVEDGLRPVDQTTAHLLQVTQNSDVTVRLDPWGRTRTTATCGYEVTISAQPADLKERERKEDNHNAAVRSVQSVFWQTQYCVKGLHSCIRATNESQTFIWRCRPFSLYTHTNTQYDRWAGLVYQTTHTTASLQY